MRQRHLILLVGSDRQMKDVSYWIGAAAHYTIGRNNRCKNKKNEAGTTAAPKRDTCSRRTLRIRVHTRGTHSGSWLKARKPNGFDKGLICGSFFRRRRGRSQARNFSIKPALWLRRPPALSEPA